MSSIDGTGGSVHVALRYLAPAGSVLAAALLMTLPLPLQWPVMPDFALLLLVIWSRLQPRLLPAWAAFLLGLAVDALFGLPFGIFATIYPLAAMLSRFGDAQLEGQDLLVDWGFAALVVLGGYLLAYVLQNLAGGAPAAAPALAQAGITILGYPLATAIAARLQRWLAGGEG